MDLRDNRAARNDKSRGMAARYRSLMALFWMPFHSTIMLLFELLETFSDATILIKVNP